MLYKNNTPCERTPWVIFDLDGTLANIDHRIKHIQTPGNKDWDKFNSIMDDDEVQPDIRELHRMVFDHGYNIAIVTGRSSQYAKGTIKWLLENNIPYNELHMREEGDFSSDYKVKQKIYDECFKVYRKVVFVVEDRDRVVKMWRDNGLTCLQCKEGDY